MYLDRAIILANNQITTGRGEMKQSDVIAKDVVYKHEQAYFVIALFVSIITYAALLVSVIGIVYVVLFMGISLFLHALMLAYIRINGVRLNPDQFPEIYEKVKALCDKIEISFVPDVYVLESSGELNAFATRFFGRNMIVLYSTIFELIEQEAEDELTFVIAHELAHIKRRHISKQLLILPAMWVPGLRQAYSRACEYTCDRYAAYYTQNLEAAKNSLTMLAIGKSLYKYVNRNQYLNQVNEEKGFFVWLSEKLSTHPPLPKRIDHIDRFLNQADQGLSANHRSITMWIWLPVSILLLTVVIGGGIYGLQKINMTTLVNEIETILYADTPPLIDAVMEADMEQINALLAEGVDPDAQDGDGWTALHWAVQDSNVDVAKALLEAGADPNLEDYYGGVPLMIAAGNGNVELVQLLLEAGADIDHQDYDGWTPLIHAVLSEQIDTVQMFLEAGADAELEDYSGSTALMHAIRLGNQDLADLIRNHR
jgi:Zn-dependent protease with chaperone function